MSRWTASRSTSGPGAAASKSWLVEHIVLNGDPGRPEVWASLTELLGRTWEHATGARLALQRLAIDTGFATQSVYQWTRSQDRATVLPVRGIGDL